MRRTVCFPRCPGMPIPQRMRCSWRWAALPLLALLIVSPHATPQDKPAFDFDPEHLSGGDPVFGSRAAVKLLGAITRGGASAAVHLRFLSEQLDPARLETAWRVPPSSSAEERAQAAARFRTAQRIVEAISVEIKGGEAPFRPPFPTVSQLLLDLVGIGPEPFRLSVVTSLQTFVDRADAAAAGAIVEALGSRLQHNSPPSAAVLEDASRILWKKHGKELLSFIIGGMRLNRVKAPETAGPYLRELRKRLRIDFPTPEGWESWWVEHEKRSLEEILVDVQQRLSQEAAGRWRQSLKRLQDSHDAAGVLAEIQEVVKTASTVEMRLASVAALGDFPEWLRDGKISKENGQTVENLRNALLQRACGLLLNVVAGEAKPFESPEVTRAALISLRKYQAFLERNSKLLEEVAAVVGPRAQELQAAGALTSGARSDLLEVVRTAGVLEVVEAAAAIEEILKSEGYERDLELLTAATDALGRLVSGNLTEELAELLIGKFRAADPTHPAAQGLRRACVTALKARPKTPAVGDQVRGFYLELLEQEKDLRIPVILGLGRLAQGEDVQALEALAGIVIDSEAYASQEVKAALDEMAYVESREALSRLLPFLSMTDKLLAKDKEIVDHLERKIVGLIKAEGVVLLSWAIESLETLAFEEDSTVFLEYCLDLHGAPELSEFVSLEKVGVGDAAKVNALWNVTLALAEVAQLAASPETATAFFDRAAALAADSTVQKEVPRAPAEIEALKRRRARQAPLAARLATPAELNPQEAVKAFGALLGADDNPRDVWRTLRWLEARLSGLAVTAAGAARPLYDQWLDYLRAPEQAALFSGLPETFLAEYVERIEALKPPPKPEESEED